jgi:hypothetical protein
MKGVAPGLRVQASGPVCRTSGPGKPEVQTTATAGLVLRAAGKL